MSGRQLAAALVAIVLLAIVLPPLAASRVHQARIARAWSDVRALAGTIAGDRRLSASRTDAWSVLAGAGEMPQWVVSGWPTARAAVPGLVGTDPWGNGYLVVLGPMPAAGTIVMSAGPNGLVETAFADVQSAPHASAAAGDDLVLPIAREGRR